MTSIKSTQDKFEDSTYLNNPNLRGLNVPNEWSKDQIEEYFRCKNDIIYFVENYVKIISLDEGRVLFKPYDYQKKLLYRFDQYRNNVAVLPRQSGKCHFRDTIYKIRNKKTGLIYEITAEQFHEWQKIKQLPEYFSDQYSVESNPKKS